MKTVNDLEVPLTLSSAKHLEKVLEIFLRDEGAVLDDFWVEDVELTNDPLEGFCHISFTADYLISRYSKRKTFYYHMERSLIKSYTPKGIEKAILHGNQYDFEVRGSL